MPEVVAALGKQSAWLTGCVSRVMADGNFRSSAHD